VTLTDKDQRINVDSLQKRIDDRSHLIHRLDTSSSRSLHLLLTIHHRLNGWPGTWPVLLEEYSQKLALFENSKLGEYLDEFIYFLFLKKIEKNVKTEDGIVIHYRQGEKAVLCLDEVDILGGWGNQKGFVSLAKQVLLFDHKEVILLNKVRFNSLVKKNCKMHFLRKHINHFIKDFESRESYFDANYH
jgi:hypothetical protein